MISIKNTVIASLVLTCFVVSVGAADKEKGNKPKARLRGPAEFQKVIDDYKAYVSTIPPEIRDEIISYRKEVAKLNREKKMLYRKLSQSSQNYLKKEQQYKKKLPLERKNLVELEKTEGRAE